MKTPSLRTLVLLLLAAAPAAHGWRSALYPVDWTPPGGNLVFNQDLFLQDFSHAGYRYGEIPLPRAPGPVFSVIDHGADPGGATDSTAAIQSAIDACEAAGGGVVFLPEGLYTVAPPGNAGEALRIDGSGVVLRGDGAGRTRILNTSTEMRGKAVVRVGNGAGSWLSAVSPRIPLTADITGPTNRIPVADTTGFSPGESVVIHAEATADWIAEHQMDTSQYWLEQGAVLGGVAFYREIIAVEPATSMLVVDTPVRYQLKQRDNAGVFRTAAQLTEVGIEDLSIGNVEHPGTGWAENDWSNPAKGAYDVHGSWLVVLRNVRHGWIRRVHSFEADGNTLGTHMLSNGILVQDSRHVTVRDCDMQKVQYGGGGGNGYTYRIQNSQEILMADCAARYQRHGIVQSSMRNAGNVFHRVLTQETKRQTGGSGSTNGSGSDHHMHFSQSILFDMADADRDFYDARWRADWGTVAHGLTATNSVYWNTRGLGAHPSQGNLVRSAQYGHGFVIGTSGVHSSVDNSTVTSRTSPADFVEGVGSGDTLEPVSLYRDQFERRTGRVLADPAVSEAAGRRTLYSGPEAYALLAAAIDWGMADSPGRFQRWTQLEGPPATILDGSSRHSLVHLPQPGVYRFECRADNGWFSASREFQVELWSEPGENTSTEAGGDTYVRGDPYNFSNYGFAHPLPVKYARLELQREAYFQFPLAGDPSDALRAEVEITVTEPGERPAVEAFLTAGGWTETALTWNTRPAFIRTLGTFTPEGILRIPIDVADLVAAYQGGEPLSVGLRTAVETTAITTVASREAPDPGDRPRLVITRSGRSLYEQWAEAEFGPATVADPAQELTVWGKVADPDGDGVRNAFECVYGTDPQAFSPSSLKLDRDGILRFGVSHRADLPAVHWSNNLDTWDPLPPDEIRVSEVTESGYEAWLQVPAPAPGSFLRLVVP